MLRQISVRDLRRGMIIALALSVALLGLISPIKNSVAYAAGNKIVDLTLEKKLAQTLTRTASNTPMHIFLEPTDPDPQETKNELAHAQAVGTQTKGTHNIAKQRRNLVGNLQEKAAQSQANLLAELKNMAEKGTASEVESYYIINAISAKVKAGEIARLAARADVKRISQVESIKQDQPIVEKEPQKREPQKRRKRSRRAAPLESNDGIEWGVHAIGAPRVWDELKIDGEGITVGVLDSGTNYKHPALKEKFAVKSDSEYADTRDGYQDFVDPQTKEPKAEAAWNHGTHVAGTILGSDGNANRIGVAPKAKLVAARAIGERDAQETDLLKAAQYLLEPNGKSDKAPRVINNSWGGDNGKSQWFAEIVKKWRAAGIVPVFAAGNIDSYAHDGSIANPGSQLDVLTVGATDIKGKLADFSRVGPSPFDETKKHIKPDVAAPGVKIRSALATGGYASWSGTSMAAPHVSGTIALMLQANPGLSVAQVEEIIRKTATPATDDRFPSSPNMGYGYGIVNAYEAVRMAQASVKETENDSGAGEQIDQEGGKDKLVDQRFQITGNVLQKGVNNTPPQVTANVPNVAFIGKDIAVNANVEDKIATSQVKVAYRFVEKASGASGAAASSATERAAASSDSDNGKYKELPMRRTAGDPRAGKYHATIPASEITGAEVEIKVTAKGYKGKHEASTNAVKVPVKPGIKPGEYTNDFENNVTGWEFSGEDSSGAVAGDWQWGKPTDNAEPKVSGGEKLLGTALGKSVSTSHLDSYAMLPPIDMSGDNAKMATLAFDEYLGFSGVAVAQVQITTDLRGPWTTIDTKLIPPNTKPQWQRVYYNLGKRWEELQKAGAQQGAAAGAAGKGNAASAAKASGAGIVDSAGSAEKAAANTAANSANTLFVRFYFRYPEHATGPGWYIDNLSLERGKAVAPQEVQGLKAVSRNSGVDLTWDAITGTGTDVLKYHVYRGTDLQKLEKIGEVLRNDLDPRFLDRKPENEKEVYYAVRAVDDFGNESAVKAAVQLKYAKPHTSHFWDASKDDNWTVGKQNNEVNDWERGQIHRVANADSVFALREAQLGLDEKMAAKDPVWGTNLGKALPKEKKDADAAASLADESGDGATVGDGTNSRDGKSAKVPENSLKAGENGENTLVNGAVSPKQHAYLQTPKFTVADANTKLEFESYNALHYLGQMQENFLTVDVLKSNGETEVLLDAPQIMATEKKFRFQWLQADLAKYSGQEISLRFTIRTTANGVINPYELGWYIDSVQIGQAAAQVEAQSADLPAIVTKLQENPQKVSGAAAGTGMENFVGAPLREAVSPDPLSATSPTSEVKATESETELIPVPDALIEIIETQHTQRIDPVTGGFNLKVSPGKWTIQASAYGFVTKKQEVTGAQAPAALAANGERAANPAPTPQAVKAEFVLEPAERKTFKGKITDASGQPVPGAKVRAVGDPRVGIIDAGENGEFTFPDVIPSEATALRAFAPGYLPADLELKTNDAGAFNFQLTKREGTQSTLTYDNGKPRTNVIHQKAERGVAVRFYPEKVGSCLTSVDLYVQEMPEVKETDLNVQVMSNDKDQRLRTLARVPKAQLKAGWNKVDLSGEPVCVNQEFFVVVTQNRKAGQTLGVAVDTQGLDQEKALSRTYLFDGDFTPATQANVVGAAMIRANMTSPVNAKAMPAEKGTEIQVTFNPDSDFDWEIVGDEVTLKKYKNTENKHVIVPNTYQGKPVTRLAKGAFAWKYLRKLELPASLKHIEGGALQFAMNAKQENEQPTVLNIPASVTQLDPEALSQTGASKLTGFAGITEFGSNVFKNTSGVEIHAPSVTKIAADAFSAHKTIKKYNLLFVDNAAQIADIDKVLLVNPAKLKVEVFLADKEQPERTDLYLGPGNSQTNYDANKKPADFYKLGAKVKVEPPRDVTLSYVESAKEVTLERPVTTTSFQALSLQGVMATPLIAQYDQKILGLSVPKAQVTATITSSDVTASAPAAQKVTANADQYGFYQLELPEKLAVGAKIALSIKDPQGKEYTTDLAALELHDLQQRQFLMDSSQKNLLVRYLGAQGVKDAQQAAKDSQGAAAGAKRTVTVPASAKDQRGQERPVRNLGALLFAGQQLQEVSGLHSQLEAIGAGAFLHNQLSKITIPDKVREIQNAAFAGNKLTELQLPVLLHQVGRNAFADNQLTQLQLGEYTGHIGAQAFARNRLREVQLPKVLEDLGEAAFAQNQLRKVVFAGAMPENASGNAPAPSPETDPGNGTHGLLHAIPAALQHVSAFIQATAPGQGKAEKPGEAQGEAAASGHSHALAEIPAKAFAENQLQEVQLPATVQEIAPDAFAGNGQIVNLILPNTQLPDSILGQDSGHIFNGVSVTVRAVDSAGKELQSTQFVGAGLTKRVGDPQLFYRSGKPVTLSAPEIDGYKLLDEATAQITPALAEENVVTFRYASLTQPEQPEPEQPAPGTPGGEPSTPSTPGAPGASQPEQPAQPDTPEKPQPTPEQPMPGSDASEKDDPAAQNDQENTLEKSPGGESNAASNATDHAQPPTPQLSDDPNVAAKNGAESAANSGAQQAKLSQTGFVGVGIYYLALGLLILGGVLLAVRSYVRRAGSARR